jgi:hypothetical protein
MADTDDDWAIRLEWRRGCEATLSITGRTETRGGLESFLRHLELARSLLASAIEARRAIDAEGGVVGDESAVPKADAQ